MRLPARAGFRAIWFLALLGSGCGGSPDGAPDVQVSLVVSPSPPKVGRAELRLTLADGEGRPSREAALEAEGNMNHAGMKPSFATLREEAPGVYVGDLDLTMGGDWFVLVTGKLADGRALRRKIDLPGVRSR